jgi:glycine/serine hydroxymethyltransferase
MKEKQMKEIAKIFKEAIINKDNSLKLSSLKKETINLCSLFPIYK